MCADWLLGVVCESIKQGNDEMLEQYVFICLLQAGNGHYKLFL